MSKYYIGQIFIDTYPPEASEFCNNSQATDNPCNIGEIEEDNGHRRFIIKPSSNKPTEQELKQRRINELQDYLSKTDWYASRFTETGVKIPEEILKKRQEAREEISRLREEITPDVMKQKDITSSSEDTEITK